jgi:UDP-glucose 4-epimerase
MILVTGGAGYIGSIMSNFLIKKNYKVVVVDNLLYGKKKNLDKKIIFHLIDLKNKINLFKILKKYKFTHIFNFAGLTDVNESQTKQKTYYNNNVTTVDHILQYMKISKVKYLIQSSTCAVYGMPKKNNYKFSEKYKCKPENVYGMTKYEAEKKIKKFSKKNKIKYVILRYFNVIGTSLDFKVGVNKRGSLFREIVYSIKKNRVFKIFGNSFPTKDGYAFRDFIDVNDLVNLHYLCLKKIEKKPSFILNCGYDNPYSVKNILGMFSKIINKKINHIVSKARQGDVPIISSNTKKLKFLFPNWKKNFSIYRSIKNVLIYENIIK